MWCTTLKVYSYRSFLFSVKYIIYRPKNRAICTRANKPSVNKVASYHPACPTTHPLTHLESKLPLVFFKADILLFSVAWQWHFPYLTAGRLGPLYPVACTTFLIDIRGPQVTPELNNELQCSVGNMWEKFTLCLYALKALLRSIVGECDSVTPR